MWHFDCHKYIWLFSISEIGQSAVKHRTILYLWSVFGLKYSTVAKSSIKIIKNVVHTNFLEFLASLLKIQLSYCTRTTTTTCVHFCKRNSASFSPSFLTQVWLVFPKAERGRLESFGKFTQFFPLSLSLSEEEEGKLREAILLICSLKTCCPHYSAEKAWPGHWSF